MDTIRVTRTYLHLPSPIALRSTALPPGARIERAHPCPLPLYRYLYTQVRRDHRWRDRLSWTDEHCAAHLAGLPNYLALGFEKFRELEYDVAR